MRIEGLETQRDGSLARASARVTWEDRVAKSRVIHFQTDAAWADHLEAAPAAFLAAVVAPALRAQERRIAVEGAVCPALRDGLTTAMQILARWYDPQRRIPAIEAGEGFRPAPGPAAARTAMFLSGGVDSLALLRCNRQDYPPDHPAAVRDAFFVYGFDIGALTPRNREDFFARARSSLEPVIQETGVGLIPVRTNLRSLAKGHIWPDEWFGLGLASVAHAFGSRISRALIASSLDVASLAPCGSHPMLDPYFSSASLRFVHEGAHLSRLAKIRLVSEWPAGLAALRVCWQDQGAGDPLNCGRCRKCLRVMMGLLVLGKLEQAPTFPVQRVTPEMLGSSEVDAHVLGFYRELLDPLEAIGRGDLAAVIRGKVAAYERGQRGSWPERLRRYGRSALRKAGRASRRFR